MSVIQNGNLSGRKTMSTSELAMIKCKAIGRSDFEIDEHRL